MKRFMRSVIKVQAFAATLFCLSLLFTGNAIALSCSYIYSVKGCDIYLTPALSPDTEYYRWMIEKTNGMNDVGITSWIFHNYTFTQIFSLDYIGEYKVILQAKDSAGDIIDYSRFIDTRMSSLGIMEQRTVAENAVSKKINIVDAIISFFNSLGMMEKFVFIIICIITSIFTFDILFFVSGSKKSIVYKATYRRK